MANEDRPTTLDAALPVGISFWAGPGDEAAILRIAAAYERATAHRRPPSAFGPVQREGSAMATQTNGQSIGAQDGLAGTAWNAVELSGTSVPPQSAPERAPHLVFGADGKVSGADGCNRLSGSYTVKGEAIQFGQIASTRMACPETDEVTRRFLAAVQGTGRWRLTAGRLEFYGATGKPLAVFERRTAAR